MNSIISPGGIKITSWGLIFIQLLSPLLFSIGAIADTRQLNNIEETIIGLESVVENSDRIYSKPAAPSVNTSAAQSAVSVPWTETGIASPFTPLPGTTPANEANNTLPSLGSDSTGAQESAEPDPLSSLATGAMQAGRILSDENAADASINYVKSVGEGLINQEINDWLSQKGTARVSIDSDAKIAGDLLYPLAESSDSLFFTQLGMRSKEDRNTVNVGLGYRQYQGAWMYGINSFYDYDYSGKNSRLGVGAELWGDYLKFSANGYFGLTDWHQSDLSDMRDYDERPASGFDIRANAWLPAYPQLGASLKYEQYFGKGIDLSGGGTPDDLKDNARAVTVGLNYTPIPLITLKAERSTGDSNETSVGLDVTWRPGVPWYQQVSPDSVDMLRSLMGSMRELVDRNYDIVMQYRKQELLRISLPQQINGRAADKLTLPLTVNKAKYGLKEVEWTASPDFYTYGGTLRQVSLTQAEIVLPAFAYDLPATPTQQYVIKAMATDRYGNKSNVATTTLMLMPSKNIVSALTVTPSTSVPANNSDAFTATAVVRDENNLPLAGQPINFSIDNLKGSDGESAATLFATGRTSNTTLTVNTDSAGIAAVKVRSKLAKEGSLRATMNNGNFKSAPLQFVADTATARIDALQILTNKALADGRSSNKLQVTVKDLNGNPIGGALVELSTTNGATLVNDSTATTDASGQATILVTSETVGDSIITARINGTSKSSTVVFIADKTTAEILEGALTATQNAVADGSAKNNVIAKITDAHGNPVPEANVTFSVSPGATLTTLTGVTGSDGVAKASVTSLKAATFTVKARIQESGNDAQTTTRFIADSSTATLSDGSLLINPNGAFANGTDTDGVEATVTDANGNLVAGVNVAFSVASGATLRELVARTGEDGKAKTTLSSERTGSYTVRATVNGHAVSKTATFVADSATAGIASGDLTVTANNAKADDKATNSVQVRVKDARGNPVPGVAVAFSATNGATLTAASAITNAEGLASISLKNTRAGVSRVTATVNDSSQLVDTTFVPDSSTATITSSNITVMTDGSVANGTGANEVRVKVTDAFANVITNATVTFSASNGATVDPSSVATDTQGLANVRITSTRAGVAKVTATVNGNSQSADTSFIADQTTAVITSSNLTVLENNAKADGQATNKVQAKVIDASGNPVSNVAVRFIVSNGATLSSAYATTDASGLASTTLTSTHTGIARVTATVNSSSQNVDTNFVADDGTAAITSGNLTVTADNARANGAATNAVQAKVTDARGNPVPGVAVSFSANNSARITTTKATTNAQGIATTTLTNTLAGVASVTATVNGTSQSINTTFVADRTTAAITDLVVTADNAKANGIATNAVKATVKDAHGNLLSGATVAFRATNGGRLTLETVATNAEGLATTTLSNTLAGETSVTATVNTTSRTVTTKFTPDSSTATLTAGNLTVTANNAKADGTAKNSVQAKITDAMGNIVPGVTVRFNVSNGAIVAYQEVISNAQGLASTSLTSTVAGVARVTVTVNGITQNVDTTFVADISTATITASNLTIFSDNARANGYMANKVQAKVTDAKGNPVKGITVSFAANNGARIGTATVATDSQGLASTTLTNTLAGTTKVTATVNGFSRSVDTTFMADQGTATIRPGNLTITVDNAKANGSATNAVQAKVTDSGGNLVPGVAVVFSANKGAKLINTTVITNAEGLAIATLTNTLSGWTDVSASIGGARETVRTTFVADETTARISGELTVSRDNVSADGVSYNIVYAMVTDANGNILKGETVGFSVDNGATLNSASYTTSWEGKAYASIRNTRAGVTKVTATINGSSQSVNVTFVADRSTMRLASGSLTVTVDNAKANGTATNAVQVRVTDAGGNVVPDATVRFTASNSARMTTSDVRTDGQGIATNTLTSMLSGPVNVTATVSYSVLTGSSSQTVTTTFVPDNSTARLISGNLSVSVNNAKANGTATNAVKAVVTDAGGNLVPGAAVTFTADNGATLVAASATTNAQGVATTTLKNTRAGVTKVTATVNGSSQSVNATFTADDSTARINSGDLTVTVNNAKANGTDSNAVQVKVTDASGNLVPAVAVAFTADNGAMLVAASARTNAQGIATSTLKSIHAGITKVTATINGSSQIVSTTFVADDTTARILSSNLTVTVNNAKANGTDSNTVQVKVTDARDNLVPGVAVSFTANNSATLAAATVTTNADGIATTTVKSTRAGISKVTATVNGSSQSVNTTFVADDSTAVIISGNLTVTANNAKANGTATNAVQVKVTDAGGNLVSGVTVSFTADNSATLGTALATTNSQGVATTTLKNSHAGVTKVTATVNDSSQSVNTTFVADDSTASIISGNLSVTMDNAKANGSATNAVQVKVTDASGNLVPGVAVSFTADNSATLVTAAATTNLQGVATTTLKNTHAGVTKVTATINGSSQSVNTTFVADDTTARIISGSLRVTSDNARADGKSTNAVQVTVTDAGGNLVPGVAVSFAVDNSATLVATSSTTDDKGVATTTLKSTRAGVAKVTATINGSSQSVETTFSADNSSARILNGNLTVTMNNATANGTATNAVQAKVSDASGNIVPEVEVLFTADNGAVISHPSVTTNAEGIATATLTNKSAGVTNVTASVNDVGQTVGTQFIADVATATLVRVSLNDAAEEKKSNGTDFFTFSALVQDANGNALPGITVNWTQDKGTRVVLQAASSVTDVNGIATMRLTSTKTETLDIQVSASIAGANAVKADKTVLFKVSLLQMKGIVSSAVDNKPLAGAKINLFQSAGDSTPLYQATSGSDGRYTIADVPQGVYNMKTSYTGYITLEETLDTRTETMVEKNVLLSPDLNGKAARIVLSWGSTPPDLDSYLWLPSSSEPIFWKNQTPTGADANLDIDARKGYGPETITISAFHSGSYCYVVNRYVSATASYKAKVRLYLADGTARTFETPAGNAFNWTVFKLENPSPGKFIVTPINKVSSSGTPGTCGA